MEVQETSKCPRCGYTVVSILYPKTGEEYVGCLNPDCLYGWKVVLDEEGNLKKEREKEEFYFRDIKDFPIFEEGIELL